LRKRETVFQPGDTAVVESRPRFLRIDCQGSPECEFAVPVLKFSGHHTKDRVRIAIELNLLSKDRGIGCVPALPQAVAQHDLVFTGSVFLRKDSPKDGTDTKHPKNTGRRAATQYTFGLTVSSDVEIRNQFCDANVFENSVLCPPIKIIGDTDRGSRGIVADGRQHVLLRVGKGS